MHRSRKALVTHAPARLQPRASALHRRGVATTYKLHDRVLSNRRARALYARHRPSLDDSQRRVVQELDESGFSVLPFSQLFPESAWQAIEGEAATFVEETETGLAQEASGGEGDLRRRAGKDFLVRKYDVSGVVGLDNPWLSACMSRKLLDIANEYLQLWSKLEYIDVWYSIPVGVDAERRASQRWHRDFDDRHLLKVFLYLRDVDAATGPFEYVPGSAPGGPYGDLWAWGTSWITDRGAEERWYPPQDELEARVPAADRFKLIGPKGTLALCDTSGFHRGGFARSKPRVLSIHTYISPDSAYETMNFAVAWRDPDVARSRQARYALT